MSDTPWWGEFDIAEQQTIAWLMGQRQLAGRRESNEYYLWNIAHEETSDQAIAIKRYYSADDLGNTGLIRHLSKATDNCVIVAPRLADRSFIAKPSAILKVLPEGEAQIYVSTPLWFSMKTPGGITLIDTPWQRPSDSWFGPSTREGELCYAKYTDARLNYEKIEHHNYRAVTPVNIINRHEEVLSIERISVSVRLLQLYHDENLNLWTQPLTIIRETGEDNAEIQLGSQNPDDLPSLNPVNDARDLSEKKTLMRNLTSLLS